MHSGLFHPAGVASAVLPAVKILDQIYSTRITLEGLATRYGMKQESWPEAVIESLKARHNAIYGQVEDQICSLGGAYHPLGETSAQPLLPILQNNIVRGQSAHLMHGLAQQSNGTQLTCTLLVTHPASVSFSEDGVLRHVATLEQDACTWCAIPTAILLPDTGFQ